MPREIKPAFGEPSVNVFFAADGAYVPYMAAAIASVLRHASPSRLYDILALHLGVGPEDRAKVSSLAEGRPNVSLRLIDVSDSLDAAEKEAGGLYATQRLTRAMYCRLLAPSILSAYGKAVYLDCDLILLEDVAGLFDMDLKGKTVGAIRNLLCIRYLLCDTHGWWLESLRMDDPRHYFCSGTLVMDLVRMREKGHEAKFLRYLAENKTPRCPDQDAMNHVLEGDVEYLDLGWVGLGWMESLGRGLLPGDLPGDLWAEYRRAVDSPRIVHYVSAAKPWKRPNLPLAGLFWENAANTPYCGQLKTDALRNLYDEVDALRGMLRPILLPLTAARFLFHAALAKLSRGESKAAHARQADEAQQAFLLLNVGRRRHAVPAALERFLRNLLKR